MGYIRLKKISNGIYAYFVETINTPNGPRQKVKQYLGRVFSFAKLDYPKISINSISNANKKEFIRTIILRELVTYGFKEKGSKYSKDKIEFCSQQFIFTKNNKKITLQANEGYLTNFTISRLLNFEKTNDLKVDGNLLANYFLQAGLTISEEEFVNYYSLV